MITTSTSTSTTKDAAVGVNQDLSIVVAVCMKCKREYRIRDLAMLPKSSLKKVKSAGNIVNWWITCDCGDLTNAMSKDNNYMSMQEKRDWAKSASYRNFDTGVHERKPVSAPVERQPTSRYLSESRPIEKGEMSEAAKHFQEAQKRALRAREMSTGEIDVQGKSEIDLQSKILENRAMMTQLDGVMKGIGRKGSALDLMRKKLSGEYRVEAKPATYAAETIVPVTTIGPEGVADLVSETFMRAFCRDLGKTFVDLSITCSDYTDILAAIGESEAAFNEIKSMYKQVDDFYAAQERAKR
jgi:hypothetical protein